MYTKTEEAVESERLVPYGTFLRCKYLYVVNVRIVRPGLKIFISSSLNAFQVAHLILYAVSTLSRSEQCVFLFAFDSMEAVLTY